MMGPQTPLSTVQEKDIEYFITELQTIKAEWSSSTNKNDLIEKVESLVEGCEIYMNGWTSDGAQKLRNIVGEINNLIQEHTLKLSGLKSTAGLTATKRVDLGVLLQQLQNLKLALESC